MTDYEQISALLARYCFVEKEIQIWRSMLEEG